MKIIIFLLTLILLQFSYSIIEIKSNQTKINNPAQESSIFISDGSAQYPLSFSCLGSNGQCDAYKDRINCNKQESVCYCKIEYATIPEYDDTNDYCNYGKKSQLTAFLVEFFAGFGGGHLYSRRYLFGSLKLVAFFFSIFLICAFPPLAKCCYDCIESDWLALITSFIYYFFAAGMTSWFIFDLVWFARNNYLDGYNVPLLEW